MNERIKKRWCVCILAVRKKDILPFPTTWTNQEDIMLSEISQRKTNTVWFHSYMESKKKSRTLETESRMVVTGGQWQGDREMLVIGYKGIK